MPIHLSYLQYALRLPSADYESHELELVFPLRNVLWDASFTFIVKN